TRHRAVSDLALRALEAARGSDRARVRRSRPRDDHPADVRVRAARARRAQAVPAGAPRRGADRRLMGPGSEPRPRGGPRARAARGSDPQPGAAPRAGAGALGVRSVAGDDRARLRAPVPGRPRGRGDGAVVPGGPMDLKPRVLAIDRFVAIYNAALAGLWAAYAGRVPHAVR